MGQYSGTATILPDAQLERVARPKQPAPVGGLLRTDPTHPPRQHDSHGMPWPTIMVLDLSGRIEAITVARDYRKRPTTAGAIAMAGKSEK